MVAVPIGDGGGRAQWVVEGAGRRLAVFLVDGRPVVVDARCPHHEAPLDEGWVEGGRVVCPWHRYSFDAATGECVNRPRLRMRVYPVHRVDGELVAEVPRDPLGLRPGR